MPEQIYNQSMCDKAIHVLSTGKSIAALANNLGVCRRTIYEWRDKHSEFAEALRKGIDACQEFWEEIGHDGALGEIKNFSAAAWIFTMKNRFREDYQEEKKDNKDDATSLLEKIITGEVKLKQD